MARRQTCGAALEAARQRFCGGRWVSGCLHETLVGMSLQERPAPHPRSEEAEPGWRERTPPVGAIGYTVSYREQSPDIAEVSVVSVLEARGPE